MPEENPMGSTGRKNG